MSLDISGITGRLEEHVETILYRVLQEAVSNVIKYANASQLHIQLVKDEDGISLSIEDNGAGFDVEKAERSEGIGLKNIRSRVKFLKGTVDIDSKVGRGTAMVIFMPA